MINSSGVFIVYLFYTEFFKLSVYLGQSSLTLNETESINLISFLTDTTDCNLVLSKLRMEQYREIDKSF